jgi:hypothetical protein
MARCRGRWAGGGVLRGRWAVYVLVISIPYQPTHYPPIDLKGASLSEKTEANLRAAVAVLHETITAALEDPSPEVRAPGRLRGLEPLERPDGAFDLRTAAGRRAGAAVWRDDGPTDRRPARRQRQPCGAVPRVLWRLDPLGARQSPVGVDVNGDDAVRRALRFRCGRSAPYRTQRQRRPRRRTVRPPILLTQARVSVTEGRSGRGLQCQ